MRHQAFSVTKSMGAALAMLRLAQKYGEQVFGLRIKDYVDVTAGHDGWAEVTFADALDMATGIGDAHRVRRPLLSNADEEGPKWRRFWRAGSAREKLDETFSFNDLPWGPGEVMRYNDSHTFVLAAAMDAFLKSKEGPEAQLWNMLADEVLEPIGVFHAPMLHTREADGGKGIPLLAVGLYPTVDDVAKIAMLLHNGGTHGGRQLLSRRRLDEALYRTPARGLPATFGSGDERTRYGNRTYHSSFWGQPYRAESGCLVHIPYMAGRGGNHVMLLPNGATAFRFADGEHYDIEPLVLAGEMIRRFCSAETDGPQAPARDVKSLGADELGAELPGNTFYSPQGWSAYFAPEGYYYVATPAGPIEFGSWRITRAGRLCWTETSGGRRREWCATAYRRGETFEIQDTYRWRILALERKQGNPEGY
jgi:CubicO group peptidase (beta-lactamase class C family)